MMSIPKETLIGDEIKSIEQHSTEIERLILEGLTESKKQIILDDINEIKLAVVAISRLVKE